MNISDALVKMVRCSRGNRHDIDHFLKVYAYAKTIAEGEKAPPAVQRTVELTAVVHDIACPLCREKYGDTNGKHQERESAPLVRQFFRGEDLDDETLERVVYLVEHHHTYTGTEGPDHQILIEADYLVNVGESGYGEENIRHTLGTVFKEELIKSTCADLRQKFSLARKKNAGILTDFKFF